MDTMETLVDLRDYVRKYGHDRNMVIDKINEMIIKLNDEQTNSTDEENAEKIIEDIGKDAENTYKELNEVQAVVDNRASPRPDETFWGYSKVNGTTFREEDLGHPLPWDIFRNGHVLGLEREPGNGRDKNAIKVIHSFGPDKLHIGYIPKDTAAKLSPLMDDNALLFWAKITEVTGGTEEKTNHGLNISIHYRKKEEEK